MGQDYDKTAKIPHMILHFNKDGDIVHEESHNLENVYLPPHAVEGIARSILPDIQSYFETEEGQSEFAKWQTEQAAQGVRKSAAKPKKRRRVKR